MINVKAACGLAFIVLVATGCQTTRDAAYSGPPVADAGTQLTGDWQGAFINTSGRSYPVTFAFTAANGTLDGRASIPSSSLDTAPTLKGTYGGADVSFETSSGFKYRTKMTTDGAGAYALSGSVSGPNNGSIELLKSK